MTVDELLDIAIQHEVSSQNLYAGMLEKTNNVEMQNFLKSLVEEEKGHEDLLTTMKEMEIYDGSIVVEDTSLIKGVEQSHTTAKEPEAPPESIEQILELALTRETKAQNLFLTLAKSSKNEELKTMFENLAEEEMNHHHDIQKKFAMQQGTMGFEM